VTLRQLLTFSTVARLGSVQASARELGISEPAVSAAVGALRRDLGDDLYRREGRALVLTAAGRHLASLAGEISDLADRARHTVGAGAEGSRRLHVAVTADVEEHVVAPLLAAFTDREPGLDATVTVTPAARFTDLLTHRRADITLGPRPAVQARRPLVVVPFLRCSLIVVAAREHRLAASVLVSRRSLREQAWCVGPGGIESGTPTGRFLASIGMPREVRAFPSDAAALLAVAEGDGVMLTLSHATRPGLRRGAIARLVVPGTPIEDRWYASTLDEASSLTAALALRRFATSAEAVQAIAATGRGVPAARVRPPVHATLWRSVGRGHR